MPRPPKREGNDDKCLSRSPNTHLPVEVGRKCKLKVRESTGFYGTTCQKLSSFRRVSVTCEAERSHPGQSRHADFEFTIRFLVKRRFPVAHDENMSCKKVYHHLGLLRILRNNHPGVQDTHPHQSKYS